MSVALPLAPAEPQCGVAALGAASGAGAGVAGGAVGSGLGSSSAALAASWSHVLERVAAKKLQLQESLKASVQDFKSWRANVGKASKPPVVLVKRPRRVVGGGPASVTYRPPLRDEDSSRLGSSHAPPRSSAHELEQPSLLESARAGESIIDVDVDIDVDRLEMDEPAEFQIDEEEDPEYTLAVIAALETDRAKCADSKEAELAAHIDHSECDATVPAVTSIEAEADALAAAAPEASISAASHSASSSDSCVYFHSCSSITSPQLPLSLPSPSPSPSSPSPSPSPSSALLTCQATGIVVASPSPELDDGRWIDGDVGYESGLVPMAPRMTCSCAFPWRSMTHLWERHVQPASHKRNIVFEGAYYPDWRGMAYPNGEPKSVLRGVSHEVAFIAVLIYGSVLFSQVSSTPGWIAAIVQIVTQLFLYSVSSQFHRRNWSMAASNRLKRLDHCAIFLVSSGQATPGAILLICDNYQLGVSTAGWVCLSWVWAGALVGCLYSLTKPLSGRVQLVGLVLMGIVAGGMVPFVYQLYFAMRPFEFAFMLLAWLIYLLGVITYSRKCLDLWPSVFGYHEIFHLLTIAGGAACCVFNFSICTRVTW